jgi:hypothetical protein
MIELKEAISVSILSCYGTFEHSHHYNDASMQ